VAGERVVLGEVARLGATLGKGALEPLGGGFGYVLVEATGLGAGNEDASDGAVLEGAVGQTMLEGGEEVLGGESCPEEEYLTSVVAGRAGLVLLQRSEVRLSSIAQVGKGAAQLVQARTVLRTARAVPIEDRALLSATG